MTNDASAFFSHSYSEARAKFLAGCAQVGLPVQSHAHPLAGRDGEPLAMDVARMGAANARRLLILSSGCHGVEGFCGSGAQIALMTELGAAGLHAQAQALGVAVLYIHALNPYGFSWWRRVTHENVDLNRNFQNFEQPLPSNPAYAEVQDLLLPPNWPPRPEVEKGIEDYIAARGLKALQAAMSAGQYEHPNGLFFGGQAPTWSNLTLRAVLREHAASCEHLGWIDFHTGLGPNGHGERIYVGPDDAAAVARAKAWWGSEVTSTYDGSSSSALLNGLMWMCVPQECPRAQFSSIAMEYGTLPMPEVMRALRAEQWLQRHPDAPLHQALAIKSAFRDAFYTDTPEWKTAIVRQAREAAVQAVAGLAGR